VFKKREKTNHSPSALVAALYRAVGNKEFRNHTFGSDYLADRFLSFHVRLLIRNAKMRARGKAKADLKTPGVYEYMLARTAFFDGVFMDALRENIPQIALLGAGYDTRAYRFADHNRGARIIELDNAATQNRKIERLKKFGMEIPDRVTYAPIDFDKQSLRSTLEHAGYDASQKTLFLWEGVTMYLEPESVDATLEFVSHSARRDSVIAFDYVIAVSDETGRDYYGAAELMRTLKTNRSIEPFKFAIDEGKLESFLDRRGLKLVGHLNHRQIEKSLAPPEVGAPIGRPNGMFRLAVASPKG